MSKWYGNLTNRLYENKNFEEDGLIKEGTDITKYLYSDRDCYYVKKVIDQKHIVIGEYDVVASKKAYGMGHQEWEYNKNESDSNEINLVFNRGAWRESYTYNQQIIDKIVARDGYFIGWNFTDKDWEKIKNGGEVKKYGEKWNISFGVRDYYYDWEF